MPQILNVGSKDEALALLKTSKIDLEQYTKLIEQFAATDPELRAKKKPCPISLEHFLAHAKTLEAIKLGDVEFLAEPREFSKGSFGWNANGKATVKIGGVPCSCQLSFNVTVANSADAPRKGMTKPTQSSERNEVTGALSQPSTGGRMDFTDGEVNDEVME